MLKFGIERVIFMVVENQAILKNKKKEVVSSFIVAILLIIFAVVLFRNPENFLSVAVSIFGYIAVAIGTLQIVFYFRTREDQRIFYKRLMTGILLISFGIVSFFENALLTDMITILLGGYLLFLNSNRLELIVNLKKYMEKTWIVLLSLSVLNIIGSILLMIMPFPNIPYNTYISASLLIVNLIYIIQNIILLISLKTDTKKRKEKKEIVEVE